MDTCNFGSDVKSLSCKKNDVKNAVGLLAVDLNRKECLFEAATHCSAFLGWIGGKWWHVMLRSCR